MGKLMTEELKMMNFKDTIKIVADGPKITRLVTFNSVKSDGYTVTVTVSGDMNNHPLGHYSDAMLFESGLFDLKISGPKEKQTSLDDEDED